MCEQERACCCILPPHLEQNLKHALCVLCRYHAAEMMRGSRRSGQMDMHALGVILCIARCCCICWLLCHACMETCPLRGVVAETI